MVRHCRHCVHHHLLLLQDKRVFHGSARLKRSTRKIASHDQLGRLGRLGAAAIRICPSRRRRFLCSGSRGRSVDPGYRLLGRRVISSRRRTACRHLPRIELPISGHGGRGQFDGKRGEDQVDVGDRLLLVQQGPFVQLLFWHATGLVLGPNVLEPDLGAVLFRPVRPVGKIFLRRCVRLRASRRLRYAAAHGFRVQKEHLGASEHRVFADLNGPFAMLRPSFRIGPFSALVPVSLKVPHPP